MRRIIYLVLITLCIQFPSIVSADQTLDQLEAREVIARYFDALKQGDTQTIQSLLDGDLLTARKSLLNNPNYPDHLIVTYKDMAYEITALETLDDGVLKVDTTIAMNDQEARKTQYLLHRAERENTTSKQLYIFAEIDATLEEY